MAEDEDFKPAMRASALELPTVIPVFPLAGAILLPKGQLPLNIFEPRYLRMIDDTLGEGRVIGMVQPRDLENDASPALYEIGCAGRITSFAETGDGRYLITLTGISRFTVNEEIETDTPYRKMRVSYSIWLDDPGTDKSVSDVDRDRLFEAMRDYLDSENLSADWEAATSAPTDALVNSLAMGCPFPPPEKQALLESPTVAERADCLIALMRMGAAEDDEDHTIQ